MASNPAKAVTPDRVWPFVKDAIAKTINKFRENPYYFFTEGDIQSYFYHVLYRSDLEVVRDDKRIYLVHREYPTNFRYEKEALLLEEFTEPYPLSSRQGDRGNYDVAVINPEFVTTAKKIEHIVNKKVRNLEDRVDADLEAVRRELLFAIEFKYVTRNTVQFVSEVIQDNKKLLFATDWGAKVAVNLVFCNHNESYTDAVAKRTAAASPRILAGFFHSYYVGKRKITPQPVWNQQNGLDWIAEKWSAPLSNLTPNS